MVECHLAKVDVEGSNPFSRSTKTATYRVKRRDRPASSRAGRAPGAPWGRLASPRGNERGWPRKLHSSRRAPRNERSGRHLVRGRRVDRRRRPDTVSRRQPTRALQRETERSGEPRRLDPTATRMLLQPLHPTPNFTPAPQFLAEKI